jgi:hypothetical protein
LKWDEEKNSAVEVNNLKEKSKSDNEEAVLRVKTLLTVLDVLVVDKEGKVITGFSKDDFLVVEDGVNQEISSFSLSDASNSPRSIVLIID